LQRKRPSGKEAGHILYGHQFLIWGYLMEQIFINLFPFGQNRSEKLIPGFNFFFFQHFFRPGFGNDNRFSPPQTLPFLQGQPK